MLNKFKDWLFKEENEEFDFDDTEVSLPKNEEKEFVNLDDVKKAMLKSETPVETVVSTVVPEEVKPKQSSINIKVDETPKKVEKSISKARLVRKDDYEVPQVISPYFGVKDEDHKGEQNPVLNKIPSDSKKDTFNNVISPFYGKTIRHDEENEVTPIKQSFNEPVYLNDETEDYEYDVDNIALDEIISNTNVEEDDLIQFSLFGDSKKIQEEEFENEEVEEENDTLPF